MSNQVSKHRRKAFKRQSGNCYYCGFPMWERESLSYLKKHKISLSIAKRFQCTAEHLHPKSEGGTDERGNIVASCVFCNRTRHKRKILPPPVEYKRQIQIRIKRGKCYPRDHHYLLLK